jgi:hypothetical protein
MREFGKKTLSTVGNWLFLIGSLLFTFDAMTVIGSVVQCDRH